MEQIHCKFRVQGLSPWVEKLGLTRHSLVGKEVNSHVGLSINMSEHTFIKGFNNVFGFFHSNINIASPSRIYFKVVDNVLRIPLDPNKLTVVPFCKFKSTLR